jgi:hypothetical protein
MEAPFLLIVYSLKKVIADSDRATPEGVMLRLRTLSISALASLTLSACASYEQQPVNYGASELYSNSVTVNNITLAAEPFDTQAEVEGAFDENLIEKGYYPIKIMIENNSDDRVLVLRDSVQLRDHSGYSYTPVSSSEMAEDFEDNKMAYALLGFGIFSYMSADEANKERSADYQAKELGQSQIIHRGRSNGAFIYFKLPQGANAASGVLSLDAEHLGSKEITRLELPLSQAYAGGSSSSSFSTSLVPTETTTSPNEPPFDGVWMLEVSHGGDKDRVQTVVHNGRFLAKFETDGWRGQLEGEINEFGTLTGNGMASKMAWGSRNVPLHFTTNYRSGGFKVETITKGRVKRTFNISLFRESAVSLSNE